MRKNTIYSRWLPALLALVLVTILAGCGSEVADDWDPITPEQARHPFGGEGHGEYLATADYDFSECTDCHGETLTGVALGIPDDPVRACTQCHRTDNHILYFDNAFEHAQYLREHEYAMDDCYVCHKAAELAAASPEIQFGATCGTAEGCHDVTLGARACNTCHGEMDEDPSVFENLAPDMGAHTTHLANNGPYATMYCNACHVQPMEPEDAGHYNDDTPGMVEIHFGAVANGGDSDPEWDADSYTCSNVYCHGGNDMDWRYQNVEFTCVSCHAYPPEEGHPAVDNCVQCHSSVVDYDGDDEDDYVDIIEENLHVNGTVNYN